MTITNDESIESGEGTKARRPVVYSVADPAPLGLGAFAMTTLALSLYNTNIWPAAIFPALALALVYGGFAQLLAGMWEFVRKNTFGAVPTAAGVFLLGWTILTFYLMIASLRVSGAVLGVFIALTVTFVLLTIGAFQSNSSITHAGGWAGIVTAAIAFYASAAGVINETFKRALVPVFPLAPKQ